MRGLRNHLSNRLSPSMAVALTALFMSLGGASYAATGGTFILGNANTATSTTSLSASGAATYGLKVVNTSTGASATAARFEAPVGHPPFTVNRSTKVGLLNADLLDGLDSPSFLRKGVAQSAAVSGAGGLLDVTNTGTTNGVQGRTGSATASGVYGENTSGGGFGVAGRAGSSGNAVYGDNSGTGWAGYFEDKVHVGGLLDCTSCVDGADVTGKVGDADRLDGLDSTAFMRGDAVGQAVAVAPGQNVSLGPALGGFLRLVYECPNPTTDSGFLVIINDSGSTANLFIERNGTPSYGQLAAGGNSRWGTTASANVFHIDAHGPLGVLSIEAATVHRAGDCHAQAQGVLTP